MAKKVKKIKKDSKKDIDLKNSSVKQKKEKVKKEKKEKKERVGFFRRISTFLKELKGEFKKIVWPTKKSLFSAILIVIFAISVMALFVVFADLLFHNLMKVLLKTL